MVKPTDWFEDDDALLSALQRRPDVRPPAFSLDGYENMHELARGGQGVVYSAVHRSERRRVAVKVLRNDRFASDADRARFEREIDVASALDHPGIVTVRESGALGDGRRYLVMDYIEGVPLDEYVLGDDRSRCASSPVESKCGVNETLGLMARVCDAVQHAHQRGVIHRDLKPANIRVDRDGRPHVLDFGMALPTNAHDQPSSVATLSGQFVGSLAWASPEQIAGSRGGVDVRTDVYSLGVVLYYLLSGRLPYDVDGTLRETVDSITSVEPTPIAQYRDLPDDAATIVHQCLAKDPTRRYQSAGDLARDLRRCLAGEPIEAKRDSAWTIMQQTMRRYRTGILAASLTVIVLAALLATTVVLYRQKSKAEAEAQANLKESNRQAHRAQVALEFLQSTYTAFEPLPMRPGEEPTVRLALDQAVARMERELKREPEVRAIVAGTLAEAYYQLARYEQAESLLENVVPVHRSALDDEALTGVARAVVVHQLAESLHVLGMTRHSLWKLDAAADAIEEAIELLRPYKSMWLSSVVEYTTSLAMLEGARQDFDRAGELMQSAVDIAGAMGEPARSQRQSVALAGLARIKHVLGDFNEAEVAFNDAIELLARTYGDSDMRTLDAREGLAQLYLDQRRSHDAIELITRTLTAFEEQFGAGHHRCGACLRTLGKAHVQLENLEEAESFYDRAIATLEATMGRDAAYLGPVHCERGAVYEATGRMSEAEAAYRRAIDLEDPRRRVTEVAEARIRLARMLVGRGELAEAEPLLRDAHQVYLDRFGADDARVVSVDRMLEDVQARQK